MDTNKHPNWPDKLASVDDAHFNHVWEVMKETFESERHFNDLETKYRILASQWLLAAFAGIGYVTTMTTTVQLGFNHLWLVVAICCVSIIGIFQLFRMDLGVYQKLLVVFFNAGKEMERHIDFIPKIKNGMDAAMRGGVARVLSEFYFLAIWVLAEIAWGVVAYIKNYSAIILVCGAVVIALAIMLVANYIMKGLKANMS